MKIKIGIPRAFLYYRDYILIKNFFEGIGCTTVLSAITNREIVDDGKALAVDESCLPFKIYLGHVKYLSDKCDYILVPRICNYGKKKRVCMRFNGLYDVVHNIFPDSNILTYNIDYLKFRFLFTEFVLMGLKFNKNIFRVIYSYIIAMKKQNKYMKELYNGQINKLKSNNLKVLIVSHSYIMYDAFLGSEVINYLNNENIDVLYSDRMDRKEAAYYADDFSHTLYWLYSKESIGSLINYKNAINGVIYLSSFPCGVDSLVNELSIRKVQGIPSINIILDESTATSGLYTRLESFVDILKARRYDE